MESYQLSYLDETSGLKVLELTAGLKKENIGTTEWQFGNHRYVFHDDRTAVAAALVGDASKVFKIDLCSGDWRDLDLALTSVGFDSLAAVSETSSIVISATDTEPSALYGADVGAHGTIHKLKSTLDITLAKDNISIATSITCATAHNLITHRFFHQPKNALFKGPLDCKPPVIVTVYGKPTGVSARNFDTQTQYRTTRGYAYVLLNYQFVCYLLDLHTVTHSHIPSLTPLHSPAAPPPSASSRSPNSTPPGASPTSRTPPPCSPTSAPSGSSTPPAPASPAAAQAGTRLFKLYAHQITRALVSASSGSPTCAPSSSSSKRMNSSHTISPVWYSPLE